VTQISKKNEKSAGIFSGRSQTRENEKGAWVAPIHSLI
jgi:tRNA (Thr-GGU) A37 N-methylase